MVSNQFIDRFRAIAERYAHRPAIVENGTRTISYGELWQAATRLGQSLRAESLVGIHLEKSPEYIIAMLAVWSAGSAFLPLDPALPAPRLDFIVQDAQPEIIITMDGQQRRFDVNTVSADSRRDAALAYVIYTSGSTGAPKGVMVEHRGIVNLMDAQIPAFRLSSASRALFYLSISFDASISDIGTALLSGATLFIEPADSIRSSVALIELLRTRRITHIDLPPPLLKILTPEQLPDTIETIIMGGEACPPAVARRWAERFRVVNVYGPTEATVCTSLALVDARNWRCAAIGAPIANIDYHLLDEHMQPVATGQPAELYISGIGLARGYLNRPQLTAAKFVYHNGERLYRTGDLVMRHEDGTIEFLGRTDRQFKLRGMLVEPEEIEARLLAHPAVQQAAVVKRKRQPRERDEILTAFIVPAATLSNTEPLREFLAEKLPSWMIPHHFEFVEKLPRTATGKADLNALTQCALTAASGASVRPEGRTETLLAEIWQRVLGIETVSVTDDFFDLGGDSLRAIEMLAAAEAGNLKLSPTAIMRYRSIRSLAAYIDTKADVDRLPYDDFTGAASSETLNQEVTRLAAEIENCRRLPSAVTTTTRAAILITGATGFLGARLLDELLGHTDAEIYCLIRGTSADQAMTRLNNNLSKRGISLSAIAAGRIIPVCGDLSEPRFGLSELEWQALAKSVDTVYHCAATVNMLAGYAELRPANVIGTQSMIKFLCTGRHKRLHYASTLSVLVASDRNTGLLLESDDLARIGYVYGGYAQSKWVAERLVRAVAGAQLPVSIYRFGLLTGDTVTGHSAPSDLLGMFIRGVAALGALPERGIDKLKIDITPVDYAARAMAYISQRGEHAMLETFHIANERSLTLAELADYLRSFGIAITNVPDWPARLAGYARDQQAAAALLALCRCLGEGDGFARNRTLDLFQATGVEFSTINTEARLTGSGIACPAPTEQLLHKYFAYILSNSVSLWRWESGSVQS